MTLTIELRGTNPQAMNVHIRYSNGANCRIKTGIKADASHFQHVVGAWILPIKENAAKNAAIKAKLNEVEQFANLCLVKDGAYPTAAAVAAHFKKAAVSPHNSRDLFAMFLKTKRGESLGRYRQYEKLGERLFQFDAKLDLKNFGVATYGAFRDYLEQDCELGDNTVAAHITMLKSLLYWCIDNGHSSINRTEVKAFDDSWTERDIIYHSQAEISAMFRVNLTGELDMARDAYLLQIMTGARHSDTDSSRWIIEGDYLRFVPKKTEHTSGTEVKVHLRPEAIALLKKYEGGKFPHFENGLYNSQIKAVGELSGINYPVRLLKGRKGYAKGESVPKYQLMSSHVARATFICLMLNNGISEAIICKMAGIGTAALKHYSHIMDETVKAASEAVYAKTGDLSAPVLRKVV